MKDCLFENGMIFTSDDTNLYADAMLVSDGTIQPIKKSAANVAMNKKNAPFPSATQSEYKQMIDFLEERPEKTPTAEAAKSEEKSE